MKYKLILLTMTLLNPFGCTQNNAQVNLATLSPATISDSTETENVSLPTDSPESTETEAVISTQMQIMTIGPSLTPLPTMGTIQRRETIDELLATNGNCKLPCWWGIIPGETSWATAEQSLSAFILREIGQGGIGVFNLNGVEYETTNYTVRFSLEDEPESRVLITLLNGIVWHINIISGQEATKYFTLERLLTLHGNPPEVWIIARSRPDSWQVAMTLFYPQDGIRAVFSQEVEASNEALIKSCFSNTPGLFLWSPLREDLEWGDIPGNRGYISADEILSVDLNSLFSEIASNPQKQLCLEIPINEFSE